MKVSLSLLSLLFSLVLLLGPAQWRGLADARGLQSFNHFHLRPDLSKQPPASVLTAAAAVIEEEVKPPPFVLFRIPSAVGNTIRTLCLVFLQSAAFMIPIGLVVKIGSRPTIPTNFQGNLRHWFGEGVQVGCEWARISALFSGGEVFCEKLRAKVDRWNSYVGSGLVSALLRMDEGPIGVAQGFVVGVGFFYLIDQMMPNNPTLNAPNPNEMAMGKGLKGKPRPMKIGTPQPRAGGRMVRM